VKLANKKFSCKKAAKFH